jgi:tRNA(Ile)-lysidine synthase
MNNFLDKFSGIETELAEFAEIKIGFSGGADSTALLILLAKLAERHSFRLEAVHFEHGIRGEESIADAEWCRNFCEHRLPAILATDARTVTFRMIQLKLPPNSPNIEALAREARMGWWEKIASNQDNAVALGHHADDKIENLFLRLLRGSNSTGLTSPRFSREIMGVKFIRPLLLVRRSEIESFLHSNGIDDWRVDRTNNDNTQMRNFIRNTVIPLIREKTPNAEKALLRSIAALEDDALHLEAEADKLYQSAKREICGEKTPVLDAYVVAKTSRALIPRVLRLWLAESLGFDAPPSSDLIERLNTAIPRGVKKSELIPLNADTFIQLCENELRVIKNEKSEKTSNNAPEELIWNWKKEPEIEWNGHVFRAKTSKLKFSQNSTKKHDFINKSHKKVCYAASLMPNRLILRKRVPGDRMTPFGTNKSIRVKKILQDSKLTSREKNALPVVTTPDEQIIWLPLIRRANFANIHANQNGKVVELTISS